MKFFAITVLAASQNVDAGHTLTNCGKPGDHMSHLVLATSPDPVQGDKPFTIHASGVLDEPISAGEIDVDLNLEALGVINQEIKGKNLYNYKPGFDKGPFNLLIGPISLPYLPFTNKLTGTVKLSNSKKEEISCVGLNLNLVGTSVGAMQNTSDGITDCTSANDHVKNLHWTNANGKFDMSGNLDEEVQKMTIKVAAKVHVGFIPVPINVNIPISLTPGFHKGPFSLTVDNNTGTPSPRTDSPDVGVDVYGTIKIDDKNNQELVCLNLDPTSGSLKSQGIFDEIKKLICEVMESGMPTHEIEDHVCKTMKYNLEVVACDKIVEIIIARIESGALHCTGFELADRRREAHAKFNEFQAKWGRAYVGEELARRFGYFEENLRRIERVQRVDNGTAVFSYLGPFADLSPEEWSKRLGPMQLPLEQVPDAPTLPTTPLDSLDWVAMGAVNPIKDQGPVHSDWAFSAVCSFEGASFVTTRKLPFLSEQNLIDCDKSCHGCDGGMPSLAMSWSARHGGVASEQSYPYDLSTCNRPTCLSAPKIFHNTGYVKIAQEDAKIADALASYGPLSACMEVGGIHQHYHGGVVKNPRCGKNVDQGVNIVGFGFDQVPYWKLRFSWGEGWGEKGYMRMERGKCHCGICHFVVAPTNVSLTAPEMLVV